MISFINKSKTNLKGNWVNLINNNGEIIYCSL